MTEKRLLDLPSGAGIVDPDKIAFIGRKDLNKYTIFFQTTGAALDVDGSDLDYMRELGVVTPVSKTE